jgi:Uma2 family endonuclease
MSTVTIMSTVEQDVAPLERGDKLSRDEFLRRWEAMPHVKRAELIGGIVYMPSPLSRKHGVTDTRLITWVGTYAASTPGCEAGNNATWLMLEDAPQPDSDLRILPEYGGQSGMEGPYAQGAPELTAEVCLSSTSYDLHQKLNLYQEAGVKEYVAVLLREREVRWHRLVDGAYQLLPSDADGVIRSVVFPGLWLHVRALLDGNMAQVLATLTQGLNTPEHTAFVAQLAQRRS